MKESVQEIFSKKQFEVVDQRDISISAAWVPSERSAGNADSAASMAMQSKHVLTSVSDQLTKEVVDLIDSAKKTAVIGSFLLADKKVEDAIFNAAEVGIRIYLLLACETRLDNDVPDDDFGKDCLEQHLSMLKRLAGRVMIRSASHYHAKVILIDAIGADEEVARGMMLTANLTHEALERNEELAVPLSGDEIKEMASILKWAFFEDAEHQMVDNRDFATAEKTKNVPFPDKLTNVLCTSKHNYSIKEKALRLISKAQGEMMVSSFGWGEDHEVIEALCVKAKEGVSVTILSRIRQASMPALVKLVEAGAKVYGFRWLHAKAIWIDENEAMVMSANLEKHGLDKSFELGVALSDVRARAVKEALELFLNGKHMELKVDISLGDVRGEIKVWEDGSLDKDFVKMEEQKDISLPDISSDCMSNMDRSPEILEHEHKWREIPAHIVRYHWNVTAPALEKGSTEVFRVKGKTKHSYSPKVFKSKKGKHSIAVSSPDEMEAASKLKKEEFPKANIVALKKTVR